MATAQPKAALPPSPAPGSEALDDARLKLQAAIGAASVATMTLGQLEAIEITGGVRFGDAVIVLPVDWFPAGDHRRPSRRSFSLEAMATDRHPVGGHGYAAARLSVLRALVAFWVLPMHVGWGHGTVVLKPTTYILRAKALLYLARETLAAGEGAGRVPGVFFGGLTEAQVLRAVEAARRAYSSAVPSLVASMDQLRARGVIHDWLPPPRPAAAGALGDGRPVPERARRGDAAPISDPDDDRTWQPLPDAFVSEQGWRALWLIEQLGPSLIGCLEKLAAEGLLGSMHKHAILKLRRVEAARKAIIARHRWQAPDGGQSGACRSPCGSAGTNA